MADKPQRSYAIGSVELANFRNQARDPEKDDYDSFVLKKSWKKDGQWNHQSVTLFGSDLLAARACIDAMIQDRVLQVRTP